MIQAVTRGCVFVALVLGGCSMEDGDSDPRGGSGKTDDPTNNPTELGFRASCSMPMVMNGIQNMLIGHLVLDGESLSSERSNWLVDFHPPPGVVEDHSFEAVVTELAHGTAVSYQFAGGAEQDGFVGSMMLTEHQREEMVAGRTTRFVENRTYVAPRETSRVIRTEVIDWTCDRSVTCEAFPAAWEACKSAEGCFDIFEPEIFACCDGSPDQGELCEELLEILEDL